MKIALCDDGAADLAELENALTNIRHQLGLEFEIAGYTSGEALLAAAKGGECFELAVLDIYFGSGADSAPEGMETARQLKALLPDIQLAFLTSSADFALDAFGLNALHYIVKPVDTNKAGELIERYFERVHRAVKPLKITYGGKIYSFSPIKLQKLVSAKRGTDVYFGGKEQPEHIPVPFAKVEEQLDYKLFLRISRGLIVKMTYISRIGNGICRMVDGSEALLSRKERSAIQSRYNDFLFTSQEAANDVK